MFAPSIQHLETRQLLSVTLSTSTYILDVTGTPGKDIVSIVLTPRRNIPVQARVS